MSVDLLEGVIVLAGECPVEDAETLLALLQEHPMAAVDLRDCTRLHLAVAQLLLAACVEIRGAPADPFLRDLFLPILDRSPD